MLKCLTPGHLHNQCAVNDKRLVTCIEVAHARVEFIFLFRRYGTCWKIRPLDSVRNCADSVLIPSGPLHPARSSQTQFQIDFGVDQKPQQLAKAETQSAKRNSTNFQIKKRHPHRIH